MRVSRKCFVVALLLNGIPFRSNYWTTSMCFSLLVLAYNAGCPPSIINCFDLFASLSITSPTLLTNSAYSWVFVNLYERLWNESKDFSDFGLDLREIRVGSSQPSIRSLRSRTSFTLIITVISPCLLSTVHSFHLYI